MRLVGCWVAGLSQLRNDLTITKRIRYGCVLYQQTFRKEARHGTIVVVGIVNVVRVELDLAVVELQVRGVVKAIIGIRLLSVFMCTTNSRASSLLATRHAPTFVFYVKANLCMRLSLPNTDKQCL